MAKRSDEYCLAAAQITGELDSVTFYEKPLLKFNRIVDGYVTLGESGYRAFEDSLPKWFNGKLNQADLISGLLRDSAPNVDWDTKLRFIEHHLSHAASAFYPSHFEKAAVLTLDGVGEYATVTVSKGDKASLIIDRQIDYPDSLGLLYSAFTYYTGFKVNSGEYKMMGLAPYGKPRFKDFILENIFVELNYSFSVNQKYFDSFAGEVIINKGFEELFKRPKRSSKEPIDQFYMDVAASAQKATEEAIIHLAKGIRLEGYSENLCLAGGVALNCVANARIRRECGFSDVWVQPAAGDAGGALGAALYTLHNEFGVERPETNVDRMHGAYLGPMLAVEQVKEQLDKDGASFDIFDEDELIDRAAKALASGKTLAWHQGRMEFGPRALGARSILADPRDPEMQKRLNLEVKKRESFRPFAPAILEEDVGDWFQDGLESPYMLFTDTLIESQRGEDPDSDSQGFDRLKELSCSVPAITRGLVREGTNCLRGDESEIS